MCSTEAAQGRTAEPPPPPRPPVRPPLHPQAFSFSSHCHHGGLQNTCRNTGLDTIPGRGTSTESLSSVHAGACGFPGTFAAAPRAFPPPRPPIFYTRRTAGASGTPQARTHTRTHTVQRNWSLKSLRGAAALSAVLAGVPPRRTWSLGAGTTVHGLRRLALGARRLSSRHPRNHCTPSSSTYVEGNQPTCRGDGEVS